MVQRYWISRASVVSVTGKPTGKPQQIEHPVVRCLLGHMGIKRGVEVSYHDPYVSRFAMGGDVFHREVKSLLSAPLSAESLREAHCVVIVTGHKTIDYRLVVAHARAVVDCCNATEFVGMDRSTVVRLGDGTRA